MARRAGGGIPDAHLIHLEMGILVELGSMSRKGDTNEMIRLARAYGGVEMHAQKVRVEVLFFPSSSSISAWLRSPR